MSMASNYNTRARAAEVLVAGDEAWLIREREAVADLLRGEQLLPRALAASSSTPTRATAQIRPSSTAWQATRAALDRSSAGRSRAAALVGVRAARVERAAGRRIQRIRHLALHRRARAAAHVHVGDRVEQHARVRMARAARTAAPCRRARPRGPRYITPTWSLTWRTTARLCEMKR